MIEIVCVSFLIVFIINYFTRKPQKQLIALSWASNFATKNNTLKRTSAYLEPAMGKTLRFATERRPRCVQIHMRVADGDEGADRRESRGLGKEAEDLEVREGVAVGDLEVSGEK